MDGARRCVFSALVRLLSSGFFLDLLDVVGDQPVGLLVNLGDAR